ncbi:hypothetical protein FGIG_11334 [Fasciola gigantica]|uniref:Uncharacterized protein n=1 Tax=Fasciola gigantica TaxID=46835 RepID=A0A504XTJ7_FASGI|nr:hypothetical protein FGIG_11334 [Fasciola gigantica]
MSHKDSYSDLVSLLNSAASDDPNQVIVAGQKLVLATTSHLRDRVFEGLATILFSLHGNNLTSSGRYVGLVHLRHSLFDSQTWSKLDASERHSIRGMLLNFLASGSDPLRMRNDIELLPQIGSCVTTFFACLVHKDWLKDEWTDDIWEQLMHWCAWSSIRSALRTLAAYRLPARRKVFTELIRSLLPVVLNLWQTNSMDLCTTKFDSLIHLSRLLYTCLTTPNLQPRHGPYLLNQDDFSVVEGVFQQSFVILDTLCSRPLGSDWSAKHVKISRRLTKLVLATFLVSNPVVRGKNVKFLLSRAANIVSHQSVHPQLDKKGMTWILALVYGLLSAKVDDPDAHLSIDSYGSSELHKCLFSRSSFEDMHHNGASSNTLLITFLQNLLHTTFPLSPIEVLGVTSDPEACMAVGGSCISLPGTDLAENVTAPDIWDIDVQAQNLVRIDLQSLINLHGSEQQFLGSQSCRQLTELIVTQLLRNYETEAKCVLLELAENMRCAATSPLHYEALMRWTQLILPYTASDPYWRTFSGRVLSSAMIFVTSRLPVTDESEYDRQLIILSARMLCFLMRCISHSIPTGANEISKFSPVSVAQLVPYLRAGAPDGVQVVPLRMCLCTRLAAAHCVAWCLSQPVFPAGTLVTHINSLFYGLVKLLYDVSQCETRVYLLSVLRSLLESTKMTNHLDLAEQMVYVLDHFWQLGTSSSPFIAQICLLGAF